MRPTKNIEVDFLPPPSALPNGTIYGLSSCTTPGRDRYIVYQSIREWAGERDTETYFTRKFLATLPKAKCRRVQRLKYEQSKTPLFVLPGFVKNAAYVDIKSAFPTLYHITGWGIEYHRGKYMMPDIDPLVWPYPAGWKVGRSYVVTGARPKRTAQIVYNGRLISKTAYNQYSNPNMVSAIYDILGACARLAVSCGAIYWNVDGGIMPLSRVAPFVSILADLEIYARIKYLGDGVAFNAGAWCVGTHNTVQMRPGRGSIMPRYGDKIGVTVSEADWILKQVYRYRRG